MINPRLRLLIKRWGRLLAAALLIAGAVAGYMAVEQYTDPVRTQLPSEEVDSFQIAADISHASTVQNRSPLYPAGTVLRDQPIYFVEHNASLALTGEVMTPQDRPVRLTYRLFIRHTASRGEQTIWSEEQLLDAGTATVRDGQFESTTLIDIFALNARADEVKEYSGELLEVSSSVIFEVQYAAAARAGDPFEGTLTVSREAVSQQGAYWLEGEDTAESSDRRVRPGGSRLETRDLSDIRGYVAASVLAALAAIALLVVRRRLPPEPQLRLAAKQAAVQQWTSPGDVGFEPSPKDVEITTLADLEDVAIDTGVRIIDDVDSPYYVVETPARTYYYREP